MVTLVNVKGEQVGGIQFPDWDEAESFLKGQRENGNRGLYLRSNFGAPIAYDGIYFIAVDFGDSYSMVIKAKHLPCPDEIMTFIESDMEKFGYSDIFEYYATDEDDVYSGYDTEDIDNWPVLGARKRSSFSKLFSLIGKKRAA